MFVTCAAPLFAQETSSEERQDEQAARQEMKEGEKMNAMEQEGHLKGEVIDLSVSARTMLVRETEYSNDAYPIIVSEETDFAGGGSLADISVGDILGIDYYSLNGKRFADNIVVEEKAAGRKEAANNQVEKVLSD